MQQGLLSSRLKLDLPKGRDLVSMSQGTSQKARMSPTGLHTLGRARLNVAASNFISVYVLITHYTDR